MRFWSRTREGLFLALALAFAFWFLGISRTVMTLTDIAAEERSGLYLLRLAAFLLIPTSVALKNRRAWIPVQARLPASVSWRKHGFESRKEAPAISMAWPRMMQSRAYPANALFMDKPRTIDTPNAPQPAGHYSQAVAHGGLVFVSGQLPVGLDVSASFAQQARQVLLQLLAILEAAGSGPADVLKVNAYIDGASNWPQFNEIFAELFGEARPARIVVPAGELRHGYLIEADAIAVAPAGGGA